MPLFVGPTRARASLPACSDVPGAAPRPRPLAPASRQPAPLWSTRVHCCAGGGRPCKPTPALPTATAPTLPRRGRGVLQGLGADRAGGGERCCAAALPAMSSWGGEAGAPRPRPRGASLGGVRRRGPHGHRCAAAAAAACCCWCCSRMCSSIWVRAGAGGMRVAVKPCGPAAYARCGRAAAGLGAERFCWSLAGQAMLTSRVDGGVLGAGVRDDSTAHWTAKGTVSAGLGGGGGTGRAEGQGRL